MSTKKTEDGFLSRWSRRKLEEKEAPEAEEAAPETAAEAGAQAEDADEAAAELTEEDVEKLGPGSDYSAFLKKGVAPHIQRLALRKLWLSNPALANLDGLVEYGDDYRASALAQVGKAISSSYKAGKGYVDDDVGEGEDGLAAAEPPEEVADAGPVGEAEDGEVAASDPPPDDGDDAEKA